MHSSRCFSSRHCERPTGVRQSSLTALWIAASLTLLAMTIIIASAPAQAQLVGGDTAPGAACSTEDALRMTANPTGTGGYILTCESGVWVATLNAALPTANEQVATKQYVDAATSGAPTYVGRTPTSYNGDWKSASGGSLQGIRALDKLCDNAFAGSRAMTCDDLEYKSLRDGPLSSVASGWVFTFQTAMNDSAAYQICLGVNLGATSGSNCGYGTVTSGGGVSYRGTDGFLTGNSCNGNLPIHCVAD